MSFNYEQFDVLHNFISPVTGRVLSDFNYVLVGNKQGIAIPSPILIDIRLDLIALRKRYNSLVKGDIVIGHPNNELPNAQVLLTLGNGYLYTTDGILSINTIIPIGDLPDLPYQNIWIGDITNRPVPQQRVGLENLPSFLSLLPTPGNIAKNYGIYNLYTGKTVISATPLDAGLPETTMRIQPCNMPNLKVGRMWIGVKNILPPLYVDPFTPPYIFINNGGDLNWDIGGIASDSYGVPNEIGLDPGFIFIGDTTPGKEGQITSTDAFIPLLTLTYKKIWRGNISNRPVEVDDLTTLELSFDALKTRVDHIEFVSLPLIDADLAAIHLEIGGILISIAALEFTVNTVLVPAVTGLTFEVNVVIPAAISGLNSRITMVENRTLDQIPLAVNVVNLNNQRIGNLADPTTPLSAVNLQFMQAAIATAIGGAITSVTGTANQITATTLSGAVTLSLPTAVIITTSLNVGNLQLIANSLISTNTNGNILINPNGTGNVDVNNHRIINLADPVNPLDAVNLQSMTALTNRTLDLIPLAAANVNINNHKLINVSDATNPLDAVNLQTMQAAISAGPVTSVLGTTNQITASTSLGVVTLSLPAAVIITTSVTAGNLTLTGNTFQSNNSNGSITVAPNGSGNLLLVPSPSTGLVGIGNTPSFLLDVFGSARVSRLRGNTSTAPTIALGASNIRGTGATASISGSELAGVLVLNTGTGITNNGIILTITLGSAFTSTDNSWILTPRNAAVIAALTVAGTYTVPNSSSTFQLRNVINLTSSTTYEWTYHIIGN